MICLTRLSGSVFALNSDLIERVDSTPDTVITLVDGTKYVVLEDLQEVVDAIRSYRGSIIAESARLTDQLEHGEYAETQPVATEDRRRLVAVPGGGDGARAEERR